MERVKILSVTGATAKNGKTYYKIQLEDGRKINSFEDKFLKLQGQEANVEITKDGQYLKIKLIEEEAKSVDATPVNMKLEIAKIVLGNLSIPTDAYVSTCESVYNWVMS